MECDVNVWFSIADHRCDVSTGTISAHGAAHSDPCRGTIGAVGEQGAGNSTEQQFLVQFDSGGAPDGHATNGYAFA